MLVRISVMYAESCSQRKLIIIAYCLFFKLHYTWFTLSVKIKDDFRLLY